MQFYHKHSGHPIRATITGTRRHMSGIWHKHWPSADSAVRIRLPLDAETEPKMGEWMGESPLAGSAEVMDR